MNKKQSLELIEIVRDILHRFCPYEKADAYKILEKLRGLESEITHSTGEKMP
jgi:hypothetical protein